MPLLSLRFLIQESGTWVDQLLMLETNATKMYHLACSRVAFLGTKTFLSSIIWCDDGTAAASSGFNILSISSIFLILLSFQGPCDCILLPKEGNLGSFKLLGDLERILASVSGHDPIGCFLHIVSSTHLFRVWLSATTQVKLISHLAPKRPPSTPPPANRPSRWYPRDFSERRMVGVILPS